MLSAVLLSFLLGGAPRDPKITLRVPYPIRLVRPDERSTIRAWVRIEDPDGLFYCPSFEWHWGDDTKSTWESDCDPDEERPVVHHPGWKTHTYEGPGSYRVEVVAKSGGKVLRADILVEIRDGSEDISIK